MAITALPIPPSRQDSTNFALRADAFLGALPTFAVEANALAEQVNMYNTNAEAYAANALNSASSASNSAGNAATIAQTVAATYDEFDDRYLGPKAVSPTTDNDGQPLLVGAMYWNTGSQDMKVWSGTGWASVQTTSSSVNAAASAASASASATSANTSAVNASNSAGNAATSANSASASATSAAASYDSFDDRYLGSKTTNPTTDNDGQTLLVGAMYWNSSASEMRVWSGNFWNPVQTTTAATNAAASANAASNSATNALASATDAANALDAFDDRYLGTKISNPSLDNDGGTLLVGAMYWNNSVNEMRVWTGSSWTPVQTTTASANAAASATAAATSASNALNYASTAQASSAAAGTSATNASNYSSLANGFLTDFKDRYLGSLSTNPVVASSGAALQKGMLYFNNTSNEMRVYSGSVWTAPAAPTSNIQVNPSNTAGNSALAYPLLSDNYGTSTTTLVHANSLTYNGTTGTLNAVHFNNLSDISLKSNVSSLSNSISILGNLSPKSFNWNASGNKDYGLIAQEVEKVLPELVESSANGIKSVSYISIIALLINAVVELNAEVKQLKAK